MAPTRPPARWGLAKPAVAGRAAWPDRLVDRDPGVGASGRAVRGVRSSVVRTGDCLDDRKAEASSLARARSFSSGESLERLLEEGVGKAGTVVGDVQFDRVVRV